MKYLSLITLCCIFFENCAPDQSNRTEEDFTQYVNPNIGTVHSRWFFYTPASLPFGMAKLAPSTNGSYGNESGWEAVGYEDAHTSIEGFACFHEFQIGGVMLMPVVGKVETQPGSLENPEEGYRSYFDKESETATPGYYSVTLNDYNTKVELTATERVGLQRYIFPETDSAYIIFDIGNQLGESGAVKDASIRLVDNQTIEGFVTTIPEYIKKYQSGADLTMYFYAKLDKPIEESIVFHRGKTPVQGNEINGIGSTMAVRFNTVQNENILVKIGLSYTSVENARLNYETEAASRTFEEVKSNAHTIWKEKLGRIKVIGGSNEDKTKFYTGLYHAILGRGLASDVNGAYPRNDGGVGQIENNERGKPIHNHYNTDAVWGAFWNLTQLWTLVYPEYFSDWIKPKIPCFCNHIYSSLPDVLSLPLKVYGISRRSKTSR
jgi:predicted alpha-1,2-mannosidase